MTMSLSGLRFWLARDRNARSAMSRTLRLAYTTSASMGAFRREPLI